MIRNFPAWIEAGGMILGTLVLAISVSSITLYRLDSLEEKVDSLGDSIKNISIIRHDVDQIKSREADTVRVFEKFSDSVDRLAISVAKMEAKLETMEKSNGR